MSTNTDHATRTTPRTAGSPRSHLDVSTITGGRAAMAYGILAMGIGVAQAVRSGDSAAQIDPGMRWILVAFTISLLVLVPVHLALGAFANSPVGARIAATGTPLLALGAASSAINGEDLAWFPVVAITANGLWLVGSVTLGVSLWRARRVPRWVAALLPVTMPVTLVGSQLGSGLVVGVFWLAVGALLVSRRPSER